MYIVFTKHTQRHQCFEGAHVLNSIIFTSAALASLHAVADVSLQDKQNLVVVRAVQGQGAA